MPLIVQRLTPRVSWVEHDVTKERYLVSAVDVVRNTFSARRENGKVLLNLNPDTWSISAPRGTIARGTLDDEGH